MKSSLQEVNHAGSLSSPEDGSTDGLRVYNLIVDRRQGQTKRDQVTY
jgi:hypothetical protein